MDAYFALFLMTGTMLLAAQSSDALICYECYDPPPNNTNVSSCDQPMNITCSPPYNLCITWVGNPGSTYKTVRDCGTSTKPGTGCYDNIDFIGEKGRACVCTTDLCNSAANFVPSDTLVCYNCSDPPPKNTNVSSCVQPRNVTCPSPNKCITWVGNPGSRYNTVRYCGTLTYSGNGCYDNVDYGGENGRACTCTNNLCNSAANFVPSNALVCYQCSDPPQDGLVSCDKPISYTCSAGYDRCFTWNGNAGSGINTIRDCGKLTIGSDGCSSNVLLSGRSGSGCTCTTNLCNDKNYNSGSVKLANEFTISSTVATLLVVFWRQ